MHLLFQQISKSPRHQEDAIRCISDQRRASCTSVNSHQCLGRQRTIKKNVFGHNIKLAQNFILFNFETDFESWTQIPCFSHLFMWQYNMYTNRSIYIRRWRFSMPLFSYKNEWENVLICAVMVWVSYMLVSYPTTNMRYCMSCVCVGEANDVRLSISSHELAAAWIEWNPFWKEDNAEATISREYAIDHRICRKY